MFYIEYGDENGKVAGEVKCKSYEKAEEKYADMEDEHTWVNIYSNNEEESIYYGCDFRPKESKNEEDNA